MDIIILLSNTIYNIILSLYPSFNSFIQLNQYSKTLYKYIIILSASFIFKNKLINYSNNFIEMMSNDYNNDSNVINKISYIEVISAITGLLAIYFTYNANKYANEIQSSILYLYPLILLLLNYGNKYMNYDSTSTSTSTNNKINLTLIILTVTIIVFYIYKYSSHKINTFILGLLSIIIATISESITLYIHETQSNNPNETIFKVYSFGLLILIALAFFNKIQLPNNLSIFVLLIGTNIIAFIGYLLRLYSIYNTNIFDFVKFTYLQPILQVIQRCFV